MSKNYREDAQKWLQLLRQGSSNYRSFLDYVENAANKGKFSLTELGTSPQELEQLRVLGCKTAAKIWLKHLRSGVEEPEVFLGYLRDEIRNGKLSPEDIGTTQTELSEFIRVSSQPRYLLRPRITT